MILFLPILINSGRPGYAGPPIITPELRARIAQVQENLRRTDEILRRLERKVGDA